MTLPRCHSCGAPIFWATTRKGARLPIDSAPRADGNLELDRDGIAAYVTPATSTDDQARLNGPRYVTHFTTCPHAQEWRRDTRTR
jgi:hypothetical protein